MLYLQKKILVLVPLESSRPSIRVIPKKTFQDIIYKQNCRKSHPKKLAGSTNS